MPASPVSFAHWHPLHELVDWYPPSAMVSRAMLSPVPVAVDPR